MSRVSDLADRFSREVMLAAWRQQANIVPVLAVGIADGMPFYPMTFVGGDSAGVVLSMRAGLCHA